jgi:hypothetical protein
MNETPPPTPCPPKPEGFSMRQFLKSPLTSLLGLAIIVASTVTPLLKESATWTDAAIGITLGVMLLLAPDKIVTKVATLLKP